MGDEIKLLEEIRDTSKNIETLLRFIRNFIIVVIIIGVISFIASCFNWLSHA